jgi:carboxypeptidase D
MYGGHLSADPNITRAASTDITPHLYFFMVKNRRTADRERIVFWFNVCPSVLYVLTECSDFIFGIKGGPGCSSFDGAMMEVGPWRWDGKSDHDFYVKEGGWEEYTTMVFSMSSMTFFRGVRLTLMQLINLRARAFRTPAQITMLKPWTS